MEKTADQKSTGVPSTQRTEYEPGTPSWVDLGTPDVASAGSFYEGLFGWETVSPGPVEQTGGYQMFNLNGKPVAGMGPLMSEGQPPAWTTYVSVADADETAEKVRANGGKILMEPMDVMDVGRMAVFMDPEGAAFAIWQPRKHIGAQLVNQPRTLCWNELNTRNPDGAKSFYEKVFNWVGDTYSGEMAYTEWKLNGRSIGGMIEMTEQWPAEARPNWMVYFGVANCDETAQKASELGGSVVVPPRDIQPGRFAVLKDPHGAVFAIFQMSEEMANG